jgi:UDP-N-acetylmuramyl pentapeptide phosphotransferase/UDP-N-acetylglucosamine-1-phosphate transferase
MPVFVIPVAFLATAVLSAALIVVLRPLLQRYALARPNARSSHAIPTPQGGGIAVVLAAFAVTAAVGAGTSLPFGTIPILAVAAIGLGLVGAVDDIRPLPAGSRLLLQVLAVAAVVILSGVRILPDAIPVTIERIVLVLGGVWFVNLVNFMDGLDWITVAEMVPLTGFVALLGSLGIVPAPTALVAAALCGALVGFAPFNRPVARLFLGDVGSLPIGLITGWLMLELAGTGAIAAAILLPLYHLLDATLTLLRRLARREKVWEAHRSHFYQQATTHGWSALTVSAAVLGLNLVLAGLAAVSLAWPAPAIQVVCVLAGLASVGVLLHRFTKPRLHEPRQEVPHRERPHPGRSS